MNRALFTALLLSLSLPAAAQVYVFAGPAWTYASAPNGGTVSEDSSDLSLMPGIGYQVSKHFAVEAAYFDPGEVLSSFDTAAVGPGQISTTTRTFDLSGWKLSLVGTLPISNTFSAMASLSAYRLEGDMREVDTLTTSAPPSASVTGTRASSGKGTAYAAGLGLGIKASPALEMRVMLEWLREKDDVFGAGANLEDTRAVSAALLYRF